MLPGDLPHFPELPPYFQHNIQLVMFSERLFSLETLVINVLSEVSTVNLHSAVWVQTGSYLQSDGAVFAASVGARFFRDWSYNNIEDNHTIWCKQKWTESILFLCFVEIALPFTTHCHLGNQWSHQSVFNIVVCYSGLLHRPLSSLLHLNSL